MVNRQVWKKKIIKKKNHMLEIDPAKWNSTIAGGESVIKLYDT